MIEEKNPDVEFDWIRILKGPIQSDQRIADRDEEQKPRPRDNKGRPPARSVQSEASTQIREPEPSAGDQSSAVTHQIDTEAAAQSFAAAEDVDELDLDAGLADTDPASGDTGIGVEQTMAGIEETPPTAAHRRLGSEGVSRLRARHAEVLARISERIGDPVRKDELKATAERLNPDTWVTDEEVRAGLEQYETVFESLRSSLGRRRRRRRRGRRGGPDRPAPAAQLDGAPAQSDTDDPIGEDAGEGDDEPDDDESDGP